MTRVLIVAASPAARAGLHSLLSGVSGLTVLEASAGPDGLTRLLAAVEADVVLLALESRGTIPLPLPVAPDRAGREPAVVVLGQDVDDGWISRAMRAGARAALPATATAEQIIAAIAAVAAGLTVVPGDTRAPRDRPALRSVTLLVPPLTHREIEVLVALADGAGNKAIGARLGISTHTVKTHVASIFAKLGASTRAEAVASAARLGLIML